MTAQSWWAKRKKLDDAAIEEIRQQRQHAEFERDNPWAKRVLV